MCYQEIGCSEPENYYRITLKADGGTTVSCMKNSFLQKKPK